MDVFFNCPLRSIHAKLFRLTDDDLSRAHFVYLASYTIAIMMLNLVPYIAYRIIDSIQSELSAKPRAVPSHTRKRPAARRPQASPHTLRKMSCDRMLWIQDLK